MICNICAFELDDPVYESETSLISLCQIFPQPTRVRICSKCAHLQTDELKDAATFYDKEYEILIEGEDDDQIYEVRNGEKIYRTGHQVAVLADKLKLERGTRILDFGCAKSSMMRTLAAERPDIETYLFDVSDRYLPFWEKFLQPSQWATYDVPGEWRDSFDVVTSFFALEHITQPSSVVAQIAGLLRPGGLFYGIVPNVLTNTADLIVIDHVNHFTRSSLDCLLTSAGLDVIEIDADAHRGAHVFVARRAGESGTASWSADAQEIAHTTRQLRDLADFWCGAAERVRNAEQSTVNDAGLAVYGAGFYGAFIKSCLVRPERISCFIDQNPYLQGSELDGVPIVPPEQLDKEIHNVFVGLNPAQARQIIRGVTAFEARDLDYFYI